MISARRAHELIDLHAAMRKEAFEAAAPYVQRFFEAGAARAAGAKLADVGAIHPAVLQHHVTR